MGEDAVSGELGVQWSRQQGAGAGGLWQALLEVVSGQVSRTGRGGLDVVDGLCLAPVLNGRLAVVVDRFPRRVVMLAGSGERVS